MSFINRKGHEYFAFKGKTKTGKPKYFASKKKSSDKGERVDELPPDFEFYENPANGTVAIRRRVSSRVTTNERNLTERLCLEMVKPDFIVAIEKDSLVVYVASRSGHASPELRFTLQSDSERTFSAERFCYKGSIDAWISIFGCAEKKLDALARALLPQLGQGSFFEF